MYIYVQKWHDRKRRK